MVDQHLLTKDTHTSSNFMHLIAELDLPEGLQRQELEDAMEGHIIRQQNLQAHTHLENLIIFFCYT